jgi:D-alanine-D-alanine ligase
MSWSHSNNGRRVRVGVIFGGRSGEHDVSLRSAQTVMAALQDAGYDITPIGVTREGMWLTSGDPMQALQQASPLFALGSGAPEAGCVIDRVEELSLKAAASSAPAVIPANGWAGDLDVIFPVLHGPMGEDGTVQGLFELAGLPYVGAGVMASAVAMDKAICKQLLAQAGIPQAPWLIVLRKEWERFGEAIQADIERELGYPCFVKPSNLGSSVGISKVRDARELPAAMREAALYDRKIVVEKGIDGRELEVSVLGNDEPEASVVGEIVPGSEFYDYEAKYVLDTSELHIPADIAPEVAAEVRALAVRAFRVLDCAGMARVDFFLERDTDRVLLNEVNTIPGFTAISMYPKLWEASGLPLPELVRRLVELSVERHAERHGGR